MVTPILFLLFIIPIVNGCLVIRYKEPPPCSCDYLLMDSFKAYQIVKDLKDQPFYGNYSYRLVSSPLFSYDECYMSMYCEGQKSLIVFDTDKMTAFDAHSADALCDRYTQKWLVDDDSGGFASYNRLYGFCVDYKAYVTLAPPTLEKCGCPYQIIDSSNALEYLSHYDYYINTMSKYELIRPSATMDQWKCPNTFSGCDGNGQKKVIIHDDGYENDYPGMWCTWSYGGWHDNVYWSIQNYKARYIFVACFDTNKPLPPAPSPICNCKRKMNDDADIGPWLRFVNFNIKMVISEDNCRMRFVCKRDSRPQMMINGKPELKNTEYHGTCDPKTGTWRVVTPAAPPAIETWEDVPIFDYSCVEPIERINDFSF